MRLQTQSLDYYTTEIHRNSSHRKDLHLLEAIKREKRPDGAKEELRGARQCQLR